MRVEGDAVRLRGSLGGAGLVAGGTVVAAVFGLLFQSLISYHFGAGAETDAYFMSLVIFAFCAKLAMLTQLKSVALPLYRRRLGSDPEAAGALAGRLFTAVTAAISGFTLLLLAAAPIVIQLLAPGFGGETRELTVTLFRVRAPALAVLAATTAGLVVLEARRRFGVTVSIQKVVPALVSVALLALVGARGGVVALAWIGLAGTVVGGVLTWVAGRSLVGVRGLREAWSDPDVRGIAQSWLRQSGSNLATFAGEWAFRVGASLLPVGLFSGVLYGRMVHDLLHGAINDSAQTVALPRFAEVAEEAPRATEAAGTPAERPAVATRKRSAGDPDALGTALGASLRALAVVSLPVALFTLVAAPRIIGLLFGRGKFLADGMVGPASVALALFAIGFFLQGLNQLVFSAAFAAELSGLVNKVQVVGHLFRTAVVVPLAIGFSYVGLVTAQVVMNLVVALLLAAWAPSAWGLATFWSRGRFARGFALKLLAISAAQLALFTLLDPLLGDPLAGGLAKQAGALVALGLAWGLVYLGLAWALHVREVTDTLGRTAGRPA
ncbi:MAG: hypothetical protein HY704_01885 [Gemmatimonadetes bacterium]|nr:hypothetical protein [Gemmatimonadota bacterium]